jgi:hypothetical protein
MLTLLVVELVELYLRILIDRTVQLYGLTVYSATYNAARQSR